MRGVVRACEGWPWLGDAPNFGAPVVLYGHKGGLKPKPLRVHSPYCEEQECRAKGWLERAMHC